MCHRSSIVQHAAAHLILSAVAIIAILEDNAIAPSLRDGAASGYVDKFAFLCTDEARCRDVVGCVLAEVHRLGFATHEEELCGRGGAIVGLEFSENGILRPRPGRVWRLRRAI